MVTDFDPSSLAGLWERVAACYGTDAQSVRDEIIAALAEAWREAVPLPEHPVLEEPSVLRALHPEPPSPEALICYLVHRLSGEADDPG